MGPDPDAAYRPLEGPTAWATPSWGHGRPAWLAGLERLGALGEEAPAWMDMVERGMLLAAAHQSGALAGLYDGGDDAGRRLLAGVATPASCGPGAEPHILANHAALVLAAETAAGGPAAVSEDRIRRLHEVACRPQVTHPVPTDHGVHDHVLGHGDYKHHPNHVRTASGGWRAYAPVAAVAAEMDRLVDFLRGDAYASLHPVAGAAYALHAVSHIGPFSAGNGRVARALAAVPLLGTASIPLVVPAASTGAYRAALAGADGGDPGALIGFVEQRCDGLVDLVVELRVSADAPDEAAALQRWCTRVQAAHRLHALLPVAVEAALGRHRRRTDLGWLPALAVAEVVAADPRPDDPRFDGRPLVIRAPPAAGRAVEERLLVDAHPVTGDGGVVVLRAEGADLAVELRCDEVVPALSAASATRLDALLDRAVTALAVRVAAEADGN